ncbi:nuclear transcription factor Y subunit B-9-like [Abeliophyllum distichum]|uniref:Nuclear transcription factor Y subunit B-9-like n=1 Tax=Abeliophyllum distichum TaxID=126358 RepID=A0ABD1UFH7_9LAMI
MERSENSKKQAGYAIRGSSSGLMVSQARNSSRGVVIREGGGSSGNNHTSWTAAQQAAGNFSNNSTGRETRHPGNTTTGLVTPVVTGSGRNDPNHRIPRQAYKREQDQYVPIANVIRIMRRILPAYAKIADDAKEVIQECVSEYISFITSEANERCHQEHRKTITAEDVLYAMEKLGFENYVEPLTVFLNKHRAQEMERSSGRAEPFTRRTISFVQSQRPAPASLQSQLPVPIAPAVQHYAPTMPTVHRQNQPNPAAINRYLMSTLGGNGEGSSSSSGRRGHPNPDFSALQFDPYGQFK